MIKRQNCKGYCGQFKQVQPWNSLFIQSRTPVDNDDEDEQDNKNNNNNNSNIVDGYCAAGDETVQIYKEAY